MFSRRPGEPRADGEVARLESQVAALVEQLRIAREINRELDEQRRALAAVNDRLMELISIDELTGLKNRRHFREALAAALSRSARRGLPLSVTMADLDGFKAYNDTFGHPAGDDVLRAVADVLRANLREHDLAARYGGEEFALLLPGADAVEARLVTERLRVAIERHPWPLRPVTASFGIFTGSPDAADAVQIIGGADQALYHAKACGRNRVSHHRDMAPQPAARIRWTVSGGLGDPREVGWAS